MSVDSILAASRFGLTFERLRLEAASQNIAIANTPNAPGHPARLMRAVAPYEAGFDAAVGATGHSASSEPMLVAMNAAPREVHDPSDPMADKSGMVSYPGVDMVQEMSTLVEASRAYEANIRAFNTLRGMALHALDIGGES
jgi:flagellar basal-body rod protein FlgC